MKIIIKKAICVVLCLVSLLGLIYVLFQLVLGKHMALTSIYVAANDLPPRHKIEERDLIHKEIPSTLVDEHIYQRKEDMIDQYTDIQGMIPAGSPIYKRMIKKESQLPDQPVLSLKDGQASFTAILEESSSIIADMRVDIYGSLENDKHEKLSGCLFENTRIIAIKDHLGNIIDSTDIDQNAYYVEIAVNKADLELLTYMKEAGDLYFYPSSSSYDQNESSPDTASCLYQYLIKELAAQKGIGS